MGLDNLVFEDLFHLFRITRSVWYRTFYVYPRILYLNRFPYILKGGTQKTHGTFQGTVPDLSLFTQLKAYRSGESLRHIYWKKFASTGIPFLREYEITTEPGLTIYVDLRRGTHRGINALKIEDTSIEILVSLVKYFLDQGIRIIIRAPGRNLYSFTGNNRIQFNDFYTSTFQLLFQKTISPAKLYRADRKSGFQSSSSLFITHLMDADLFAFIEESLGMKNTISVIFNHAACEDQDLALQYFNRLRDRGAKILWLGILILLLRILEQYVLRIALAFVISAIVPLTFKYILHSEISIYLILGLVWLKTAAGLIFYRSSGRVKEIFRLRRAFFNGPSGSE
ncbi:hypothetical protein ES703_104073 [subsurface metagenome]